MSDGGIYILHTPGTCEGSMEYRVMHLYDVKDIWGKLPNGRVDYDTISGCNLNNIFGKTKVYTDKEEAQECASKLYYRLELSDPALIKNGINAVHLSEPFMYYVETDKNKPKKTKKAAKKTTNNEEPNVKKTVKKVKGKKREEGDGRKK